MVKQQINYLRNLEEFDLILKDIASPDYKKIGFKTPKPTLDFIKNAEKERANIAKKIDPVHLEKYERIMKRYGGRVVVQVINGFCGGCYIKLPSEIASKCKLEVTNCPNCGRFLYYVK
ncbi:MAG: C4-type zinc ribbon domain-containing protein [candidate division WOR-3 bacterium]|nr:C4-type zinc ribbon domain-containing protein [candidate division WOR-3 bacterium]